MSGHCRSKLFSLVGREILLPDCKITGWILEHLPKMFFRIQLESGNIEVYHRSEFNLLPLPRDQRRPEWLDDDFDGFVYANEPRF